MPLPLLYFSVIWGELSCCPTAAQGPQSPKPCPTLQLCRPKLWPLAFACQALQNSGFVPCSCAVPASQSKQEKPVRRGSPQILSWRGCVFSVAALWRGHCRAASPESLSSVHHGYTQLHSQVNRGHQGIAGGWFERKARGEHSPCRLGWTPSLFPS